MREDEHEEDEELLKSVVGFVFFGVPHHGMTTESLVPLFQDQPNRALLESLGKNSDLLSRLQKDFDKAISAQHPEVVSYYETESSPTACKVSIRRSFFFFFGGSPLPKLNKNPSTLTIR